MADKKKKKNDTFSDSDLQNSRIRCLKRLCGLPSAKILRDAPQTDINLIHQRGFIVQVLRERKKGRSDWGGGGVEGGLGAPQPKAWMAKLLSGIRSEDGTVVGFNTLTGSRGCDETQFHPQQQRPKSLFYIPE